MSRMTDPGNSLCFSRKMRHATDRSRFPYFFQLKRASRKPFQIPCVFSMKMPLAFKVIVNLHVMRSIAPTFLVFFHRKCASQESCRIPWVHFPCVFSSKISLGFTSDCENSHVMRPTALGFCIFFQLKRASRKPFQIPAVFSMNMPLAFKVIVNLHVTRSTAPTFLFFFKEHAPRRNPAAFVGFTFFVFSQAIRVLRSEVIMNLHVMRPTAPWFPMFLCLAGGIPRGSHCHCKFSFIP